MSPATKHRALALLDSLFKTLEDRGHAVRLLSNNQPRPRCALEVGNRIDRDLEKRLRDLLELDVLDSEEADPRRVDAIVEAIGSHGYDIALAATAAARRGYGKEGVLLVARAHVRMG